MKNLIRLLVTALLATALTAQDGSLLRIGSWNLEFFGGPPAMRSVFLEGGKRKELPARDDQDLQKIGAFVRELGVSMLAVQEIGNEATLRALAQQIGPTWTVCLGTTGGWTDGKALQAIGFLYDGARLELLWAEEMLDFPREKDSVPIFHRVPVTACFRDRKSGLDFRAVCVHLKAGKETNDRKKRLLEAQGLRDWLTTLQTSAAEDQDIVVLGDFNSGYGTDAQEALESSGAARYLKQVRAEPTIMHFDDPIDQIAPSPRFLEVLPETFDAHGEAAQPDKETWRKTYSDHFPVTVTMKSEGDDDPQSTFSRGKQEHRLPATERAAKDQPAPTRSRSEEMFKPGVEVLVLFVDGRNPVEGSLLTGLGDWVELRDATGAIRAFPKASVHEVRRR
jgi:hypothetical protein